MTNVFNKRLFNLIKDILTNIEKCHKINLTRIVAPCHKTKFHRSHHNAISAMNWQRYAMKSGTDTMSSVPSELYRPVFFFYFSFFRLLFFLSFGHSFTRVSSNSFHFDASRFLFLRVKSRVFTKERGIGKNSVHVSALSYLLSCSSS